MSEIKVISSLTEQEDNQQKVPVRLFKITDIPEVMENMGWVVAARFMRKWFYDPFYEMTMEEKLNKVDMALIDECHIVDDISFEWLCTASERVSPVIDDVLESISIVREFNDTLGKIEGGVKQLSNGLIAMINCLYKQGLVDLKTYSIKNIALDYEELSAIELDRKSQFNYFSIGSTLWEKATDELDDVYGALGSFIVKIAFLNLIVSSDNDGFYRIEINQIGLYVRDTYEFMNDGNDQPLGYWGWHGVIKPGLINELFESEVVSKNGNDYYRVTNNSFVEYRQKCKKESNMKTGDFFVYSTVKKIPVDVIVHISKLDLLEYQSRSDKVA
ncbi:hypothetical protein SOJ80_000735 [Cronobacter universalis]|nr:hypothetical protein [Cronobacter universalis]